MATGYGKGPRGPGAVAVRPEDTSDAYGHQTWFRDATGAGKKDGTVLKAGWLNEMIGERIRLAAVSGIPLGRSIPDDNFLADAIVAMIVSKIDENGLAVSTAIEEAITAALTSENVVSLIDVMLGTTWRANAATLLAAMSSLEKAAARVALDVQPTTDPVFLGAPLAPTASPGTSTGQIATTAFVNAAIAALTSGAPGTLDTFLEVYNQFLADESTAADLTATVGGKLAKASNLSDLTNAATARSNLGLGSSAVVDVGTSAGKVVQLDGTGKLPAIDGSQLTNLPSAPVSTVFSRTGAVAARADDYASFNGLRTIGNLKIVASVAANALTLAIKNKAGNDASAGDPIVINFRNATAGTGDDVSRTVSAALSVTVPASQVLGTANNVPFRLWLVALDNAGTVELGVYQSVVGGASPTGVSPLEDNDIVSSTAIAAAPNAGTIYSTTARANVAMRVLGYVDYNSGLATAGTWVSTPTRIRLYDGGALPGRLVQAQYGKTSTPASSTSASLADTGLAVTIKPTAPCNPILLSATQADVSANATATYTQIALLRGSTSILGITAIAASGSASLNPVFVAAAYMDAPGVASSVTYKTQFARFAGSGTVTVQSSNSTSTLTAQEIMA